MAARLVMRQRVAPIVTGAALAGLALFPKNTLHAEAVETPEPRKPIYDDYEAIAPAPTAPSTRQPPASTKPTTPTPTDRLAEQIGRSRVFLHAHVAAAENKINEFMDSALNLEESFTSTIASLAPSPQSGERLMPGSLYVLVAAMGGSILSRNRNILLRATFPAAVGIGAGWVVLPNTMTNIADLLWKYEQRFPAIADGHLRTREGIEKAWRMARIHTRQAVSSVDETVHAGRGAVEDWVKKGK